MISVDASDASNILLIYAKLSTSGEITETEEQMKLADVDKDGSVSASDASIVLAYYAYLSTLKPGETAVSLDMYINKKTA